MHLKYRRILYLIFITLFLLIAPILIIDATGYRYNFKKNRLEKTGILYLDSQPHGALIYLNGKYQDTTPTRFSRLLPEKYFTEIRKEGFYVWQQNLEVKSNLTTFRRDITLFKISQPNNIISGEINLINASPNGEKIIYSIIKPETEEIKIYNLKNKTNITLISLPRNSFNQLTFLNWSPNQTKILIQKTIGNFNQYLIADAETLNIKELNDLTSLNFENLHWGGNDDFYLYGLRNGILYQIDSINSRVNLLSYAGISDFFSQTNTIYLITKNQGETFLEKIKLPLSESNQTSKIKLSVLTNLSFLPTKPGYLVLKDKKNNDLIVIKDEIFSTDNINENIIFTGAAKKTSFSQNDNNLLYYTDFELSFFDFESGQKELVTRYSEPIKEAIFYPANEKYVFYILNNAVKVIEIDSEEIKNDLILAQPEIAENLIIDGSGKNLYFKGKINGENGIYQLEIQ
ncbi:MAG TPA: PEGA domain-containing protein [Patescibacteria group bacterium]|nr:PEGA domain-containing protein [Patescibacteria group bacterium]